MTSNISSEFGLKVRRQDRRALSNAQIELMRRAIQEISLVLGPLNDLYSASHLTIALTSAKPIIRGHWKAQGVYRPRTRTIVLGVPEGDELVSIHSLAHEIGHWLDWISAPSQAWRQKYLPFLMGQSADNINWSTSYVDTKIEIDGNPSLISQLLPRGCRYRTHYEAYLDQPWEVWGRLCEYYIADRLECLGITAPVSVYPISRLRVNDAFWGQSDWVEWLGPAVEKQVQARLWMARMNCGLGDPGEPIMPLEFSGAIRWLYTLSRGCGAVPPNSSSG